MPPTVLIVSPALADANNGNWRTAARWQGFIAECAAVRVVREWNGEPADALIALHARRSGPSIARFAAVRPGTPLAVVLTGTDLYRDVPQGDADALHSLQCASRLVVLQEAALHRLPPRLAAKARVIVQSAPALVRPRPAAGPVTFVAAGHLRAEKDPLTLMAAVRALAPHADVRVLHIGAALEPALGEAAARTMAEGPRYRWLGPLPADETRERIASAHALVHPSRVEGGANVVVEAVRSGVPVLATRIDGNVGLLGADYAGYCEPGDAPALAALMQRFAAEPAFARRLAAQCAARAPAYAPEAERAAVQGLLADMLEGAGAGS